MRNKLIGLAILVLMVVGPISCGEDENEQKKSLIINGQTIDLRNANFFYVAEGNGSYVSTSKLEGSVSPSHVYRDYVITDGTLDMWHGTAHWSSSNYSDATYIIMIELSIPFGESFKGGSFPQNGFWNDINSDSQFSYFWVKVIGDNAEFLQTGVEHGDPIIALGDWDNKGTMTIKIDANDLYEEESDEYDKSVKISFKGRIKENKFNPS